MTQKQKTKISKGVKRHHNLKKVKQEVKTLLWFILIISIILQLRPAGVIAEDHFNHNFGFPTAEEKTELKDKVIAEIITQAKIHGVDEDKALKIAYCESRYDTQARNWQGSSASGVYQFINSTWANYCEGDVFDYKDNVRCFMELYPKHPSWWACSGILGYN